MTYYELLGIEESAEINEVKSAYRGLAKKYHPDRNKQQGAKQRFIAITEAYQILVDDELRQAYDLRLNGRRSKESMLRNKEEQYREWFQRYQQQAKSNAENYAGSTFDEFENSPIYKTAMVLSKAYDYIFFGIGVVMVFGPLTLWYLREADSPDARPWYMFLFPSLVGIIFTYGIYHFLFKYKANEAH